MPRAKRDYRGEFVNEFLELDRGGRESYATVTVLAKRRGLDKETILAAVTRGAVRTAKLRNGVKIFCIEDVAALKPSETADASPQPTA
jgi:hypothetical protein